MKPTDFWPYASREIDGVPWRLIGSALSIDYESHHVQIQLWGTDEATNTVFNLKMEAAKYWVPPSQRKKKYPRELVVPVATWDEHFPEEEMSSEAVTRFHQLKQFTGDMFGTVVWRTEHEPTPMGPDDNSP